MVPPTAWRTALIERHLSRSDYHKSTTIDRLQSRSLPFKMLSKCTFWSGFTSWLRYCLTGAQSSEKASPCDPRCRYAPISLSYRSSWNALSTDPQQDGKIGRNDLGSPQIRFLSAYSSLVWRCSGDSLPPRSCEEQLIGVFKLIYCLINWFKNCT